MKFIVNLKGGIIFLNFILDDISICFYNFRKVLLYIVYFEYLEGKEVWV